MSLEDLKNFFQSEHQRQEDLENFALRVKEKDMIDQLNQLKIQRQELTGKKQEQEQALGHLMGEFADRKDIEIRAKIEVEDIQK